MFLKGKKAIVDPFTLVVYIARFNMALVLLAFILCVSLVFAFLKGRKDVNFSMQAQSNSLSIVPELNFTKKSIKYYERVLSRRQAFIAGQAEKKEAPIPEVSLGAGIEVEISDLQLQGIFSSARGLKAMIENTKTSQSFDCIGGEVIGGFVVKEVFPDKVILQKGEEKIELRL